MDKARSIVFTHHLPNKEATKFKHNLPDIDTPSVDVPDVRIIDYEKDLPSSSILIKIINKNPSSSNAKPNTVIFKYFTLHDFINPLPSHLYSEINKIGEIIVREIDKNRIGLPNHNHLFEHKFPEFPKKVPKSKSKRPVTTCD